MIIPNVREKPHAAIREQNPAICADLVEVREIGVDVVAKAAISLVANQEHLVLQTIVLCGGAHSVDLRKVPVIGAHPANVNLRQVVRMRSHHVAAFHICHGASADDEHWMIWIQFLYVIV